MTNEYKFLKKQRYEYYKGTTEIMDNEVNELVEDVVDVLNQKAYNINELLKIKQFQAQRIAELEEQLAEKEKEIVQLKEDYEHCNDLRKLEVEKNNNYHTEKYGLDKPVEELRKIKLSMPEKEWYYKVFDNCERQFASHIADLTLQIKEKDEEIERQKSVAEFYKSYYTGFHERLVDELLKLNNEILAIDSVPKNNNSAMDMKLSVVDLIDKKISKIREVK